MTRLLKLAVLSVLAMALCGRASLAQGQVVTITDVRAWGQSANTATINWNTSGAATSLVEYGLTSSYGSATTRDIAYVRDHSVTLAGLAPNTTYHFRVRSMSGFKEAFSADYTFTTTDMAITGVAPVALGEQYVAILWNTSTPMTSQVEYGPTLQYGSTTPLDSSLQTSHRVELSLLCSNGDYHYRVHSRDAEGNEAVSGDYTFHSPSLYIETPGISILSTTSMEITWSTLAPGTSQVEYGPTESYGSRTPLDKTMDLVHTVTLTGLDGYQLYHFRYRSIESNGFETVSPDFAYGPILGIHDLNAYPYLTGAYITWGTHRAGSSQVEYGLTAGYGSSTPLDPTRHLDHDATLTGLSAYTTYHYRVRSVDESGNVMVSNDQTFFTDNCLVTNVTTKGITANSATVRWGTNGVMTDTQLEYGPTQSYGSTTTLDPTLSTDHSVAIAGLSFGTTYHFRPRSKDASGHEAVTGDYTFRTLGFYLTDVKVARLTGETATITWITTQPADSGASYGLAADNYTISLPTRFSKVTQHSLTLTGLSKNTTYHFRVMSTDSTGYSVTSDDYSFTMPDLAVFDVKAISVTKSTARVNWTTSRPATSQVEYGLTTSYGQTTGLDGALASTHSMEISGLAPDCTYHFRVRSRDAAGVEGVSDDGTFRTTLAEWLITLQAASGPIANSGASYLGIAVGSVDQRDGKDAFQPSLPDPSIQLYEMRNDWAGGSKVKSDVRAPYSNGTKVWSNWHLWTNAEVGTEIALSWDPGAEGLPVGSYLMTVSFAPGVTDPDGNPLDDGPRVYDLSAAGSVHLVTADSGVAQASMAMVCKVGDGPDLLKRLAVTSDGTSSTAINCAPIVDENGFAYFGSDLVRRIYKVNAALDAIPAATRLPDLAAGQGNVKGRLALYNGFVYGVTDAGYVVKRNASGATSGNWAVSVGANASSVPAVLGDGTVYVGAGNALKKLSSAGAVVGTSPALPGTVGSASIPGTDLVWVNAGNSLVCLNSNLSMVRASIDLGDPACAPSTRPGLDGRTVVAAGNRFVTLNATSMELLTDRTVDGAIGGAPASDGLGNVLFATSAHKLYKGNPWSNGDFVSTLLTGAAAPITGTPIVGANWTAIAGGNDQSVYLVNNATGAVTSLGVNQATLGCTTDLAGHIYFTSTDGNLYVIE